MEHFTKQEALKPYFDNAYGWAVLPVVGKAGIGVGGAFGNGIVYKNDKDGSYGTRVGDVSMFQASFGFQLGAQVFSEIIFLETEKDYENFTSGNFEFGAEANVVALTASASAKISTVGNQGLQAGLTPDDIKVTNNLAGPAACKYVKGMSVYTVMQGGLMYEATISGQKFNFVPKDRFTIAD